jgi:hypothetical protein
MPDKPQTNLQNSSTVDNGQKPQKRDLFKTLFKRKDKAQTQSPQTLIPSSDVITGPRPSHTNTGERQRTRAKYLDAAKLLGETIKMYEGQ